VDVRLREQREENAAVSGGGGAAEECASDGGRRHGVGRVRLGPATWGSRKKGRLGGAREAGLVEMLGRRGLDPKWIMSFY
jgi:hypothetical protein